MNYLTDLKPNPDNPRTISEVDFNKLVRKIKRNPDGLTAKKIVHKDGIVIDGNQRFRALLQLNEEEQFKIKDDWFKDVTGWTDKQIKEWIVTANVSDGEWDNALLYAQYEPEELEEYGIEVPKTETEVEEDEAPEVEESEPPKSELGKIYQLGRHRVMCGDSTDFGQVSDLLDGAEINLIFTDPPYNQSLSNGGLADKRPNWSKHKENGLSEFDPKAFLDVLTTLDIPTAYIFSSKNLLKDYITWAENVTRTWNLLVMRKSNPIPMKNNTFLADVEWLFFSRGKGATFNNDLEYDYYRRVFDTEVKASEYGHPTEKRVKTISRFILISSNPSDIVLDLFLGSGSTLIACEQTDRICYGMELDPKYVDVIRKRYAKFISPDNELPENWQELTPAISDEKQTEATNGVS